MVTCSNNDKFRKQLAHQAKLLTESTNLKANKFYGKCEKHK